MQRVLDNEKFGAPDVSGADGSWFDYTKKRFNPQNLQIRGQGGSEKRGDPGVVVHTTTSALRNGAALTPQLAPYNTATDAEYSVENGPANDVLPKIERLPREAVARMLRSGGRICVALPPTRRCPYGRTADKGERTAPALMPGGRRR